MVRPYTIFSSALRQQAKQRGMTPLDYFEKATQYSNSRWDTLTESQKADELCLLQSSWIEVAVAQERATHIFLQSKEFSDWLVGCVPYFQGEHAEGLADWLGQNVGVLHFPTEAKLDSMAFWVAKKGVFNPVWQDEHVNDDSTCLWLRGSLPKCLAYHTPLTKEATSSGDCAEPIESGDYYTKLVVGLAMYRSCFPEMVRPGVPHDLKHVSMHQYRQIQTFGVSPKVLGGTHDSPTAHFRRGHFRVLISERYTHKRFQAIFIHETFVAGRAVTVEEPEEQTIVE